MQLQVVGGDLHPVGAAHLDQAGIDGPGFGALDGLAAAELTGATKIYRNAEGVLCWKPFSERGNQPAYIFNAVDETANH